jgi:predicted nucleic acid-binding protein
MRYLLDTCVISEIFKDSPHPGVDTWFQKTHEMDMHLSVLSLGELEKGIHKLSDGRKKASLAVWVDDLAEQFQERTLPINEAVAVMWGRLQAEAEKKGRPLPAIDGLLAATAKVHELTLVTRNDSDMEAAGIPIFNPWT